MPTTAEILIETLLEWGIDRIFGVPGDGSNGIMEAIREAQLKERLQCITTLRNSCIRSGLPLNPVPVAMRVRFG
jgi:thiamine pyrophosphate-dependent acetolactate synthase large subunit-like protein